MLENLADVLVVVAIIELWQDAVTKVAVLFKDSLCLIVEWYTNGTRIMSFGLLCDVFNCSVNDVVRAQSEQVAGATSYQALEHEDVSIHLHSSATFAEVSIINFVTLFEIEIERRSVYHLWSLEGCKRVIGGELVLQTIVSDCMYATEDCIETVL